MLSEYDDGSLHELWRRNNTNFVAAINALKYYAYKPFSSDPKENFIDTRTFFYMREYLFGLEAEYPAAFATTWVQNIAEDNVTHSEPVWTGGRVSSSFCYYLGPEYRRRQCHSQ